MSSESLTDLQLAVMKALWRVEAGSLGEIHAALQRDGRTLAPTTVATLLQRLSAQGWVKRRRHGQKFEYRALIAEQEAAANGLSRLVSAFFGGKVSALTAQLLGSNQLSEAELEELRQLLARRTE